MKMKLFLKKYSHAWVFLYAFIYIPWFSYLEKEVTTRYYLIHSPLDQYIPFIEYFVVPYLLWFVFLAVITFYIFFTDKKGFYKLAAFLVIGMTVFLIVCSIYPNGLNLRPSTFARDNIFVELVKLIYTVDTPTNVLPSIHVFNSLGAGIAVAHSKSFKNKKAVRYSVYAMAGLIILSTVFLKQHSVLDVFAAFILAGIIYPFVYAPAKKKTPEFSRQPVV